MSAYELPAFYAASELPPEPVLQRLSVEQWELDQLSSLANRFAHQWLVEAIDAASWGERLAILVCRRQVCWARLMRTWLGHDEWLQGGPR